MLEATQGKGNDESFQKKWGQMKNYIEPETGTGFTEGNEGNKEGRLYRIGGHGGKRFTWWVPSHCRFVRFVSFCK